MRLWYLRVTQETGRMDTCHHPPPELHHCLRTSMFPELLFLFVFHFVIFVLEHTEKDILLNFYCKNTVPQIYINKPYT